MKVDGSCFCGYLTFAAEIDPATVQLCHCKDCQILGGSAFRVVVPALDGSFRLLTGEPTIYVKTAESGNRRGLAFCPKCGTAIYSGPADTSSKYFGMRAPTLRQFWELVPTHSVWHRSSVPWLDKLTQMPSDEIESPL
jgi:hypothetical protein